MEFRGQFLIMQRIGDEEAGYWRDSVGCALCREMHRFGKEVCRPNLYSGDADFLLDPRLLSFILTEKSMIGE